MSNRTNSITEPEDEVEFVRDCLRQLATDIQSRGEIPADVPQPELYHEVEKHVPQILSAVQRNAMYHEWKRTGHLPPTLNPMKARPPEPKRKKPMTLDAFAASIQADFAAINRRLDTVAAKEDLKVATKEEVREIRDGLAMVTEVMATKADLKTLRDEMATKEDIRSVRDVMATKEDLKRLRDDLIQEIAKGQHLNELRERLARVERRLGIGTVELYP